MAGGSPAAGYLFLRGQENVTEKKAAQFAVPCGDKPALLDKPGVCGTRTKRSDSPRRNPRSCLRLLGGSHGTNE
jgi:hypothetical protein